MYEDRAMDYGPSISLDNAKHEKEMKTNLGQDGTLREATVVASVISKISIPVMESSAALLRLTEVRQRGKGELFCHSFLPICVFSIAPAASFLLRCPIMV